MEVEAFELKEMRESRAWRYYSEQLLAEIESAKEDLATEKDVESIRITQGKIHGIRGALMLLDLLVQELEAQALEKKEGKK